MRRLIAVPLVFALMTDVAWAYWTTASVSGGNGASAASVNAGPTPTTSATGAAVTVSWAATTLQRAGRQRLPHQRYDAVTPFAVQTVLSACTGTVTATYCSVTMTTAYVNGQDTLAFTNQNGITGTWTAATGVLALTGSATVVQYQSALRSITYNDNSDVPTTTTRTVTFVANDGILDSTTASRTIALTAVNDAPVNSVPGAQSTGTSAAKVFSTGNGNLISVSDPDAAFSGAGPVGLHQRDREPVGGHRADLQRRGRHR